MNLLPSIYAGIGGASRFSSEGFDRRGDVLRFVETLEVLYDLTPKSELTESDVREIAEKATNMVCQPITVRLSDGCGRVRFVFAGGGAYGLVAVGIPASPVLGTVAGAPTSLPGFGTVPAAFLPLVGFSALLGVADAFREPASMALFADEGTSDGGVVSSFGIRELVWRPGSVVAALLGGWLTVEVSMTSVFYVGGAFAITGGARCSVFWWSHTGDQLSTSGSGEILKGLLIDPSGV